MLNKTVMLLKRDSVKVGKDQDVYKYIINRDQIINFSKYEDLVNRKKSP